MKVTSNKELAVKNFKWALVDPLGRVIALFEGDLAPQYLIDGFYGPGSMSLIEVEVE